MFFLLNFTNISLFKIFRNSLELVGQSSPVIEDKSGDNIDNLTGFTASGVGDSDRASGASIRQRADSDEDSHMREQRTKGQQDLIRKRKRESVSTEQRELAQGTESAGVKLAGTKQTKKKAPKKKVVKMPDQEEAESVPFDYHTELIRIGFSNPVYPHEQTMKDLGIYQDVMTLLTACDLQDFVLRPFPACPAAAAEFLATIKVNDFPDNSATMKSMGGGFITFKFEGKHQMLNFKEINEVFGFKDGEPKKQVVCDMDMSTAWGLLTEEKVMPKQPTAKKVRHPVINYARRIIARTAYGRAEPTVINDCDMILLTISFAKMFANAPKPFYLDGDESEAGMAYTLCRSLELLKGKISGLAKKGHKYEELGIGGLITGILEKAGVSLDKYEKKEPVFMDIEYLKATGYLAEPIEGPRYYYQFTPNDGLGNGTLHTFELPNEEITSIVDPADVNFKPASDLLVDTSILGNAKAPGTARKQPTANPSQKRNVSPPAVIQPCECTTDEYRAQLIQELTPGITRNVQASLREVMQIEMDQKIKAGIEKSIAELKETYGKKPPPKASEGSARPQPPAGTSKAPLGTVKSTQERTETSIHKTSAPISKTPFGHTKKSQQEQRRQGSSKAPPKETGHNRSNNRTPPPPPPRRN